MRNILITGGSGFLGRALAKRLIETDGADRICIFSRNEWNQIQLRDFLKDDSRLRFMIGDVRDKDRLRRALHGVDLVIHAAALKRVEVGEYNPREMVLTNVQGTINLIEAAQDTHVARVVAVSSDKACAPLNAYGATKLTMEKLILSANNTGGRDGPLFAVVRYGNVAGSTGSVIPYFRSLLKQGVTLLPVTDPNCRRFWMTAEQAVELILWTAENMLGGETVVPLLPAYRLDHLVEAMGARYKVNGVGPGEKMDEMMVAPWESLEFRSHPPYLVRGGLAKQYESPNMGGVRTHMLDVEELKGLLEALP